MNYLLYNVLIYDSLTDLLILNEQPLADSVNLQPLAYEHLMQLLIMLFLNLSPLGSEQFMQWLLNLQLFGLLYYIDMNFCYSILISKYKITVIKI